MFIGKVSIKYWRTRVNLLYVEQGHGLSEALLVRDGLPVHSPMDWDQLDFS